jgi:molybdenum cofactor biosynthesis enzyme MoaA
MVTSTNGLKLIEMHPLLVYTDVNRVTTANYHMVISTNGLKLIEMHPLWVYADVNLLGDSIDTVKKNTYTLIDVSREVGLEVNAEN